MRAGVAVLLSVLLIAPSGLAADPGPGPLAKTLDDHIGQIREDLDQANATYGEREEFRLSRAELSRSGLALLNNATLLTEDGLIKASAALATGQARAEAQGSSDPAQQVVDEAQAKIDQADAMLRQTRSDLASMEQTGLEPVALDGGLAVAHALVRVMDMRHQHQIAMQKWNEGDHSEPVVRSVMTGAEGALRMAQIAQDTLANLAQAREDAPPTPVLSYESLRSITQDRVDWTQGKGSPLVQRSHARVQAIHSNGEQLMTLAAYMTLFQDLAFNGLQTEYQRDKTETDPYQIATDLLDETQPAVDAWIDDLGIPGDFPAGAMASGELALTLSGNASGDNKANSGAYAASLIHLGAEHVGILQQAYGGPDHEPGSELAMPGQTSATSTNEAGSDAPPLWLIGILLAVVLVAVVRFWRQHT